MTLRRFNIVSLNTSKDRGTKKSPVDRVFFEKGIGIVGDAHAGSSLKQVSFLAVEDIDKARKKHPGLRPGDFAENITTKGVELVSFPIGARFNIGDAVFEVTQKGKPGKNHFIKGLDVEPLLVKRGVFAKVIKGGGITNEDIGYYDI